MPVRLALKDRPIAFIDTETTGLDPTKHEIIEFAALIGNRQVHFKMKLEQPETADPKALEVNGYTPEKWEGSIPQAEGARQIAQELKGCVLVGHNVRFDAGFINETLKRHGIKERVDYYLIDTMTLAWEQLVPCGLKSLSLASVCKFLRVPEGGHTALGDARACREVYYKMLRAGALKRLWWKVRS